MMTDEQIHRLSYEERDAWLASLNDDENAIVHTPFGHRCTLVMVSIIKRILAAEISTSYRLQFLEWLDKIGREWMSPESVALIEPMCDAGYEMVSEAQKLGAKKALDVYAKHEVFSAFVALNPSLLTVLKMPPTYRSRAEYSHFPGEQHA
jgi:hypothetical protein